jgi:hypothetical protein
MEFGQFLPQIDVFGKTESNLIWILSENLKKKSTHKNLYTGTCFVIN